MDLDYTSQRHPPRDKVRRLKSSVDEVSANQYHHHHGRHLNNPAHRKDQPGHRYDRQPPRVIPQSILTKPSQARLGHKTTRSKEKRSRSVDDDFIDHHVRRNVRFEDVPSDTDSSIEDFNPPVSSQRYAHTYEPLGRVVDSVEDSPRVEGNISPEPRYMMPSTNTNAYSSRAAANNDWEHRLAREDRKANKYASHSGHGPSSPEPNHHSVHEDAPRSAFQLGKSSLHRNREAHDHQHPSRHDASSFPRTSEYTHHRYQPPSSSRQPQVITIDDDSEEELPTAHRVSGNCDIRQSRYSDQHRPKQLKTLGGNLIARAPTSHQANGLGYTTDAETHQKRGKDRSRSRVRRNQHGADVISRYAQTDDEDFRHHVRRNPNGTRSTKRHHSPEFAADDYTSSRRNNLPEYAKRPRLAHARDHGGEVVDPNCSQLKPLRDEPNRADGGGISSRLMPGTHSGSSSHQQGKVFMDEDSEEDAWPMPENRTPKNATDNKDTFGKESQRKPGGTQAKAMPPPSLPNLSGISASQALRARAKEKKTSQSVKKDSALDDLFEDQPSDSDRTGLSKDSSPIHGVPRAPPSSQPDRQGLLKISSPSSTSSPGPSGNEKLTRSQLMQRIREANTQVEYSRASASITCSPKAPLPALEAIEISSAESSDSSDLSSDLSSSSSDNEDDGAARKKKQPAEPAGTKPNSLPSAKGPNANATSPTAKKPPPARRRGDGTNAVAIRKFLRAQDDKETKKKASAPTAAPQPKHAGGRGRPAANSKVRAAKANDGESGWSQAMAFLDQGERPASPTRSAGAEDDYDEEEEDSEIERGIREAARQEEELRARREGLVKAREEARRKKKGEGVVVDEEAAGKRKKKAPAKTKKKAEPKKKKAEPKKKKAPAKKKGAVAKKSEEFVVEEVEDEEQLRDAEDAEFGLVEDEGLQELAEEAVDEMEVDMAHADTEEVGVDEQAVADSEIAEFDDLFDDAPAFMGDDSHDSASKPQNVPAGEESDVDDVSKGQPSNEVENGKEAANHGLPPLLSPPPFSSVVGDESPAAAATQDTTGDPPTQTLENTLNTDTLGEGHQSNQPASDASLQSILANATKKDLEETRPDIRKAPNSTAREVAQRNAARRDQALATGPLKKPPQVACTNAAAKKTPATNGVGRPAKPKGSAFIPTPKPKRQAASQTQKQANSNRLPRESDLVAPKASKKTSSSAAAAAPPKRPSTVLHDPNSTDYGPCADKTPSTPYSVITEDDKQLYEWREKGLTWAAVRALFAALTGKKFSEHGIRYRYKRVLDRFPELGKEKKNKEELKGLPALVAAQEAEKQAAAAEVQGAEDDDPQQPLPIGGKKWNHDAYEQYRTNQNAISDFLTDAEPSDDDDDDDDSVSTTIPATAKPPPTTTRTITEPQPLDENEVWFQYHVTRQSFHTPTSSSPSSPSDDPPPTYTIGSPSYPTLRAANALAGAEILLPRHGLPGASPASTSFSCTVDAHGLHHYRAACPLGAVRVDVSRTLRAPLAPGDRPLELDARDWLPGRRMWVVRVREEGVVKVWKPVAAAAVEDDLFGDGGEAGFAEVEMRTETGHGVLGTFTVLDAANREAGAAWLEVAAPRSARIDGAERREGVRRELEGELDGLEERGARFERGVEREGEGRTVVFWVEEVGVGGPRNV